MLQILRHISHPQLSELADWACNEVGNLHASQVSHLRHGKLKMLGVKCVDALGRMNQAAWAFHQRPELLERLGTAERTPRIEAILRRFEPLLHPDSGAPLGAGEFMELYLGYLRLPITPPLSLSEEQAERLAGRIGAWLDGALAERGLSFREASRRLRLAWPGEASGVERLIRVIGGLEEYTARQLGRGVGADRRRLRGGAGDRRRRPQPGRTAVWRRGRRRAASRPSQRRHLPGPPRRGAASAARPEPAAPRARARGRPGGRQAEGCTNRNSFGSNLYDSVQGSYDSCHRRLPCILPFDSSCPVPSPAAAPWPPR